MTQSELHPVVFVGAGPGDPELITVAGRRALEEADVVVYAGSLVSKEMLSWTKPGVEAKDSASLDLGAIVEILLEGHRKGQRVVRLHTGDPSLYGAIREQIEELDRAEVPYRVIPGVTAAFGAAAALGLEFTLPEVCQTLILTRAAGRTPVPEAEALESLASHRTSMAIYLSGALAEKTAQSLEPALGPDAPLCVVYRATWPEEQIVWTTVRDLARDMTRAGVNKHALILAGPAVSMLKSTNKPPASKLYDAKFSHGCRTASK